MSSVYEMKTEIQWVGTGEGIMLCGQAEISAYHIVKQTSPNCYFSGDCRPEMSH